MNNRKYRNAPHYAAHLVASIREDLRVRSAARAANRRLQADLASYTTKTDIDDLLAAVDREESLEAEAMRDVLHSKLQHLNRVNYLAA